MFVKNEEFHVCKNVTLYSCCVILFFLTRRIILCEDLCLSKLHTSCL